MSSLKAILKILALALWSIPLVLIQIIALWFIKGRAAYIIPRIWHCGVAAILGLKIELRGDIVHDKQLIYISNHLSYLDIPVIGTVLKASFIAKEDIAHWPVIGYLCRMQQTAFISRNSRHAKKVAGALEDMLAEGKSLILFPEGTSTVGTSVLPFKSSLFSLLEPKESSPPLPIQPFILELVSVNKKPITAASRDLYSWYGDMDFSPHMWVFLKNNGATVRLTFLDVIHPPTPFDRKTLCKTVEERITSGLNNANTL